MCGLCCWLLYEPLTKHFGFLFRGCEVQFVQALLQVIYSGFHLG